MLRKIREDDTGGMPEQVHFLWTDTSELCRLRILRLLQPCFIMPLSSIWPKTRGISVQGLVLRGCLFAVLPDEQRIGHGVFQVADG